MNQTSFLEAGDRRIAYHLSEGRKPSVMFFGGFRSDMTGSKAMALEAYCQKKGHRFIRFDYTGHGESSGDFKQGTIGAWLADALEVMDKLGGEKLVLVGSSMGAWIALLAALARKEKIIGLMGIASAPDFTEKLIWEQLTPAQKHQMQNEGMIEVPDCYGDTPYAIMKQLVEEGRGHLILSELIGLTMPVRLLHGTKDDDVPWQMSVLLQERLQSKDCQLMLVKDGNHRMSEPHQLEIMCNTLNSLMFSLTGH